MRVLLTGADGQVGWELQRQTPLGVTLDACGRQALDITDFSAVQRYFSQSLPEVVINCAAYTAVDRAESESERAFAINRDGAANLAQAVKEINAHFIHLSTDFIFNGRQSTPYTPDSTADPLSVYGQSKWQGEARVRDILGDNALILRTAWVYSSHGQNFVKTMLRLMRERSQLGVVVDQIGTPTWAATIATLIWRLLQQHKVLQGTLHVTDLGVASWYDFAVAIYQEGQRLGLLQREVVINPITTQDYPTAALRPAYSVLEKGDSWRLAAWQPPHWRDALIQMLSELAVPSVAS
ncbi:MAG: dTDP-4-dehydrorhamnose reductase [Gammaproteobacteria bacterium]|nr:dTDP-4-dehydrorhamnose reductase [Gammaproteobacteria bacterium]